MKIVIGALAVIVAALLGIVAASCGVGRGAESAGPVPTAAPGGEVAGTSGGTTSVVNEGGSSTLSGTLTLVTYQVWFTRDESLFMVKRDEPSTPRIATAAVQSLLAGPSPREQSAAVGSQIPAGTQLLGLTIEDGVATVDLTSEFESGGGSASMNIRIAQVVYTLTQFPAVDSVEIDGKRYTRADFEEQTPAILVESPLPFEAVTSPIRATGTANTFEATFNYEVVDADGKVVDENFVTATSGTGTRGTFEFTTGDFDSIGKLVVFEPSAEDGSRTKLVEIHTRTERGTTAGEDHAAGTVIVAGLVESIS